MRKIDKQFLDPGSVKEDGCLLKIPTRENLFSQTLHDVPAFFERHQQ
jgi:hypothetical protein